jgi:hypothetical protein
MDIRLTYDAVLGAWELTHRNVRIETPADAAEWQRQLARELQKLGNNPVYALINVSEFDVAEPMMAEYGRTVASIAHHFHGVARYGAGEKTRTAVLLESMLYGFPPNLFPDREAAVKALESMRVYGRRSR